jgi:hypothetical protein
LSLDISEQTEARIAEEARKQGLSVDALLQRLIDDRASSVNGKTIENPSLELPVLHLGPIGPLHRRDIYSDVD